MAHIRLATSQDRDAIREVHLQAFPEGEGALVANLSGNLLSEESDPATISLVAECRDEVVGHVAFSPVFSDVNKQWPGYILAPLAVKPKHHKTGIGSKLVERGIARLTEEGVNVLFVYGDPKFYEQFGFRAEATVRFLPPCELKYPFGWLAKVLHETGTEEQTVQLSCVASLRDPELW